MSVLKRAKCLACRLLTKLGLKKKPCKACPLPKKSAAKKASKKK